MIIHRQTMLTENDSSEHLLAKIKNQNQFLFYNHMITKKFQLTIVLFNLKAFKINHIKMRAFRIDFRNHASERLK